MSWCALACAATLSGCSIRSLAINTLAEALAESGSVYASDSDPELVRDALPFALKTFESLLESVSLPREWNPGCGPGIGPRG